MSANPTARGTGATASGQWRFIPFFLTQLSTAIQVWIERSRQRRELGELADRKDHLLADIGLSVEEARHEAAKPFWAFSDGRRGAPASRRGGRLNECSVATEHVRVRDLWRWERAGRIWIKLP